MMPKKTIVLLMGCFLLTFVAPTRAENKQQTQIYSLFVQANDAFRQANSTANTVERAQLYDKAILNYEKIITDGQIKNAKLYYNLANVYLLKRDIGRAILNYLRAEGLDNGNTDIMKNLAFARNMRVDKVEIKPEKQVLQTLFFWHYDFSYKMRFLLASIFFAILCLSLTFLIWSGRNSSAITIAIVAGLFLLCFAGSVSIDAYDHANQKFGVITISEVIARQGDGTNYPPSFKEPLHAGTEFSLLESRPGWIHIKLTDNSDGWIPSNAGGLVL